MSKNVLGTWLTFRNGSRSPERSDAGAYPVFGSNGVIGAADESNTTSPCIVIGRVGSYCGSVHWSPEPAWVTENSLVAMAKSEAHARFWYYALLNLGLNRWKHGSGQALLNQRILSEIAVNPPEFDARVPIAEMLGALEDKITANRRVAAGADTLRAALWQRMTDGASQAPLSSIARFVNGKAFTKDAAGTGKIVIRIAELNSGVGTSTVYNDIDVAEDHLARPGDLLMAWSGSLTAARWYRDEAIVNQHIFKVIPSDANPLWAVACAVETKMSEFQMVAATKATTMGHIQRRHLDEPVHWPELSDDERDLGGSLWTRALLAERENEQLVAARNELLPLLMSGRITVEDAEKRVEQEV
jgi:type I restriction enzyme S subunit